MSDAAAAAAPAPPDWGAVRALFDAVAELDAPARARALADPMLDPAVAEEVRSLCRHAEGASLLDRPPGPAVADPASRLGERLGAWRIVDHLGSGGMGEVWLARRDDGAYEHRAAIKVLKRGLDTGSVLARFALEQQALARLDHPHIARLIDAGRTADGLPYFVMEHVDGLPIDQACAGRPLAARLALFLQLADAVAHAHRQLLLHRDLKPGNVLVDRAGQVKLLDFGIAKALVGDEAGGTQLGLRPYTPHYASPEQVRGEAVGTATDVYSLGVLLYVMLTGRRPYARAVTQPAEVAQRVLDEAPARPSTLAPPGAGAPGGPPGRRRLAGDLDTLLLKALAKEPAQRYASVDALAADVRAHLEGRPLAARPPSPGYLAARFVRRHRAAVGAAAAALLALVAGLAATAWQAREAERARALAEQRFADVRALANRLVFRYHDELAALPNTLKLRQELLDDAQRYLDGLHRHVGRDPALARELSETYQRLATLQGEAFSPGLEQLDAAQANLDKAVALLPLYADAPGLDSAGLQAAAELWLAQASQSSRRADLPRARQALEQAQALAERALARPDPGPALQALRATIDGRLGQLLGGGAAQPNLGRPREAAALLAACERRLQALAEAAPQQATWQHQAAWAQQLQAHAANLRGDADRAAEAAERMRALRDRAARLSQDDPHLQHQRAVARLISALYLAHAGRAEAAQATMDEAQAMLRASVDRDPRNQAAWRDLRIGAFHQGRVLWLAGERRRAQAVLAAALQALPAPPLAQDAYVARARAEAQVWAARAWQADDPAQALALAEAAAAALRDGPPDDPNATRWWTLAQAVGERAEALARTGRGAAAAEAAREALALWQRGSPEGEPPGLFTPWVARDRRLAAGDRP
ncbi:serine/threonine-protein kinase [Piscinibacter sakaiensis]|uniref:Protein kinase domain-containing protein n=1 Tax=Piscinibacter sakaiensis TaxID=1547922 RepID=A0A0K8NXM8_PISS1|nr:serine/threonine-protein kinase [Piscinibacter sakaiensis]GAP34665.1 hypothetical protein ISF6_5373 [Piscinibacter sakaiensis]